VVSERVAYTSLLCTRLTELGTACDQQAMQNKSRTPREPATVVDTTLDVRVASPRHKGQPGGRTQEIRVQVGLHSRREQAALNANRLAGRTSCRCQACCGSL
jgi:hypothetical protein